MSIFVLIIYNNVVGYIFVKNSEKITIVNIRKGAKFKFQSMHIRVYVNNDVDTNVLIFKNYELYIIINLK